MDGKVDLGRVTKKSVIGLGKVLHAAETFNPEPKVAKEPVKSSPVKQITGSRRDRYNSLNQLDNKTGDHLTEIQLIEIVIFQLIETLLIS